MLLSSLYISCNNTRFAEKSSFISYWFGLQSCSDSSLACPPLSSAAIVFFVWCWCIPDCWNHHKNCVCFFKKNPSKTNTWSFYWSALRHSWSSGIISLPYTDTTGDPVQTDFAANVTKIYWGFYSIVLVSISHRRLSLYFHAVTGKLSPELLENQSVAHSVLDKYLRELNHPAEWILRKVQLLVVNIISFLLLLDKLYLYYVVRQGKFLLWKVVYYERAKANWQRPD